MEYQRFLDEIKMLDFIRDQDQADAAVKAVLGILASRLPEAQARIMAEKLPGPLSLERLRGMQQDVTNISFEMYVIDLMRQFSLDRDQVHQLISRVLPLARETMGGEIYESLLAHLPPDWVGGLNRLVSAAAAQP